MSVETLNVASIASDLEEIKTTLTSIEVNAKKEAHKNLCHQKDLVIAGDACGCGVLYTDPQPRPKGPYSHRGDSIAMEYEQATSVIRDAVAKAVGPDKQCLAVYEAYKCNDDYSVIYNNLDCKAIKGKCQFVRTYDITECYWNTVYHEDEAKGTFYLSEWVTEPTWLDVMVLFNDSMLTTGNERHYFLEGVYRCKNNNSVFHFCYGS